MTAAEALGRYVLYEPIARGGMATVHTARLVGAEGFSRLVAAKRLHAQFAEDPEFVTMLHDEARIASKIHHPNVVPVLDVVVVADEVILVQEYVHGLSLAALMRAAAASNVPVPTGVVAAVLTGVLAGLHAAHEANDELGVHLGIVHRDVSPQNVMVSVDGVPRLLDFGIAKAKNRAQHTRQGFMKGKMGYMAPEQLRMEPITRRVDLYAAGVLLWELLVNRRFYNRENEAAFLVSVLKGDTLTVSAALGARIADDRRDAVLALEAVVARAMEIAPEKRFADAAEMLDAVGRACPPASQMEVARWVRTMGTADLAQREKMLAANEESWRSSSKISISMPALGSGVRRGLPPPEEEAVAATVPVDQVESRAPTRGARGGIGRLLPWLVSCTLGIVLAIFVGAPLVRDLAPRRAEPTPVVTSDAAVAVAPPAPIAPPKPVDTFDAATAAAPRNAQGAAPPVHVTRAPHASQAAPPAHNAAPSPPPAATPEPAVTDCNPPFYFSGSRKVFKASCL